MTDQKSIRSALISVFNKEGLDELAHKLAKANVKIYSTGGTATYLENLGIKVHAVEDLTSYPSILGGRVKTLHPKVFGGILARREDEGHMQQLSQYDIPEIDMVVVDLYPFEDTVASGADHQSVIEKIDIGGIALIRAAAKNYHDVAIVPSRDNYAQVVEWLGNDASLSLDQRRKLSAAAFGVSSHYDAQIHQYIMGEDEPEWFKSSVKGGMSLRYGENPHQKGTFFGDFDGLFKQLHGKAISYNNLLDVNAAVELMMDFVEGDPCFAILKHNNACGLAIRPTVKEAYLRALESDSVSAFGGVLISNKAIDADAAEEINKLFCEVLIAPDFSKEAMEILTQKKNRILLKWNIQELPDVQFRTVLNGVLVQDRDTATETESDLTTVTKISPTEQQVQDMLFASKLVKHTKSNAIILAKDNALLASGTGQTSRVDALRQAIEKAGSFDQHLKGSVMASDAFFPFPDCAEIAHESGVEAIIQPGGSVRDKETTDFCDANGMAMVHTGTRHFKH